MKNPHSPTASNLRRIHMNEIPDDIRRLAIKVAEELLKQQYEEERKNNPAVRTVWWFMTGKKP